MPGPHLLGYSTWPFRGEGTPLQNPVVLVRGLGRSSGFWLEFIDALTPWAKVITVDLFGTGKSPSAWGRGTVAGLAEDLVATLVHERLLPCHLVGISLGGMVCLEAAARIARVAFAQSHSASPQDNDIASLTVMASSARSTGERRISPRALGPLVYALRNRVPRNREFAQWLVSPEALAARPDLPEIWDAIWEREGFHKVAVLRQLLAAAAFDGRSALRALGKPACFVASRDDRLVDWKNSLRLWERVPGARLVLLNGPGHDFPTEKPEETARIVTDFARDVESGLVR